MTVGFTMKSADDGFVYHGNGRKCRWLVDTDETTVKVVEVGGPKPYARSFFAALLECSNVKEAIKSFSLEEDNCLYKMNVRQGVSGCEDLILETAYTVKGLDVISKYNVLHITMCGKVDRDFYRFSFRELVEIANYFELLQSEARVDLLADEEVKFFNAKSVDDSFGKGATVIYE